MQLLELTHFYIVSAHKATHNETGNPIMAATTYENKVKILSRFNRVIDKMPILAPVADRDSLGLNLAMLIDYRIVTERNEKITLVIDSCFGFVISIYGIEDTGFEEAWQIDPNLPMPDAWLDDDDEEEEED